MTPLEFTFFLLAWGLAGASPGPATLAIASTSMNRGRAAGIAVAAGIVAGSATWGIAAALGMSAVMLANAWAVEILRYVGAAYLIFLGYKALRSAMSDKPMTQARAKSGSLKTIFVKGMMLHVTNPKAIFSWGAVFAIVVPPGSTPQDIAYTFLALVIVSNIVFFGYALLFSTAAMVRGYQKLRRPFEFCFGLLFGLAGLKILTAKLA